MGKHAQLVQDELQGGVSQRFMKWRPHLMRHMHCCIYFEIIMPFL